MSHAELLNQFQGRVDEFERYQNFIARAQSQQGKFASAVVEKVVSDNTARSREVVEAVAPMVDRLLTVIEGFRTERSEVLSGRQTSQFALEELELRLAIGEISDADFEQSAADLKAAVAAIDGRVSGIDRDLESYAAAMARWDSLSVASGLVGPRAAPVVAAPAQPELPPLSDIDDEVDVEEEDEPSSPVVVAPAPVAAPAPAPEAEKPATAYAGVASIFEDDAPDAASDSILGDELDILGEDDDEEEGSQDKATPRPPEDGRRAVLLYLEGTADEKAYPLGSVPLTIGRGRENDVQVKNDSKVSRHHCKIERRGPHFYIVDNSSANGSLVDGELITERRLFGGEEVIIGETFFRFRILD